jgi:adenosylcobyric acid synthase
MGHDKGMTRAIAVLGSASDVGKSLVAAGLGRLLADAGFAVAPFKAQNMGNQAGVTAEGLEMPRAQILQARACRVAPSVDMGPVLMKPMSPTGAQIVVLGRAAGQREAKDYFRSTAELAAVADAALDRLAARHGALVLEGAGSPVELNLMARDFVNLRPARRLGAALVLVVDIHKGGVFAQAKGTLDLLPAEDRARVLGLVVNRFQGDPELFEDGVARLEELCGVPVLAVVSHLDHGLDEEDRPLRIPVDAPPLPGKLNVGAVLYPRVANTEDLHPLLAEPDVHLTWITRPDRVAGRDLLVLPGSKATVADLAHATATGLVPALHAAVGAGAWLLGLCGGYQMLGRDLVDEGGTEGGASHWPGLGLLPVSTVFHGDKHTVEAAFESLWPEAGHPLAGYEIHHGRSAAEGGEALVRGAGAEVGLRHGRAVGCYLHGLLASDPWRGAFLNAVRADRGLPLQPVRASDPLDLRLQRWADHLKGSLRPGAWERLLAAVRPA